MGLLLAAAAELLPPGVPARRRAAPWLPQRPAAAAAALNRPVKADESVSSAATRCTGLAAELSSAMQCTSRQLRSVGDAVSGEGSLE